MAAHGGAPGFQGHAGAGEVGRCSGPRPESSLKEASGPYAVCASSYEKRSEQVAADAGVSSQQRIQWTGCSARSHLEHMGVNHGGADIRMTQQLLHPQELRCCVDAAFAPCAHASE